MRKLFLVITVAFISGLSAQDVSFVQFEDIEERSGTEIQPEESFVGETLNETTREEGFRKRAQGGMEERLIKKANGYFEKMWYAEAARIYDIVLEESDQEHTFELLSKAADAHYYSGNMEKSYKWYHELYQNHKKTITEENFFKYSHSLKATGRYKRAARLTRLFRQKREKTLKVQSRQNPIWDNSAYVELKNMAINSKYSDFSPMFHGDGKVVYASAMDSSFLTTRRYRWNNQPFLDLYVARQNESQEDLVGAGKLSRKINTKYHEASVAFSPDQETIYFTRNNYGKKKKLRRGKKGVNHLKIYSSNLIDGEWTKATELPFNSENYSNGHPAISPDGKKMYFVSDRPGGFGLTDIYVVDILENGKFSEPKNLGKSVNTPYKEMFPYITGKSLYFSSDRTMGTGGLDIYKSDYSGELFNVAINMGKPINSNRDDFSYIIDEETQKGYFASNRKGGKGDDDIYSFKNLMNLNAIAGVVDNLENKKLLADVVVALFNEEGEKLMETTTDSLGNFMFEELLPSKTYNLVSLKEGFVEEKTLVSTKDNERIFLEQSITPIKELVVRENEVLKVNTENIYFDFDKFNIKAQAAEELDKLVDLMKSYPEMVIRIESHTDSRGTRAYNKYLSDKRAKSSRDYIVSKGIEASRIESAIGYGEERLLNDCSDGVRCSGKNHNLNRRSEFIIVNM
ncbi:OmpA family protein [Flagellimonas meridianipacifica]|uniref:WD40 repeat protein n=1 Tax=Flagellimonas meridianipacifica TaxID=1080225 RepID=A0A2T0MH68_9FLAO|nr:OmpA family protein [Allomuricauda pacifica]PRX56921.1 WD40 repeat protein [Allomuricauda pacifica]